MIRKQFKKKLATQTLKTIIWLTTYHLSEVALHHIEQLALDDFLLTLFNTQDCLVVS